MSGKSFTFKNIFLGMLLGITAVAGWAFYPQIQSAVQTRLPVVSAKLSQTAPDNAGEPNAVLPEADAAADEKAAGEAPKPPPVAAAVEKTVADDPLQQAPAVTRQGDDDPVQQTPAVADQGDGDPVAADPLEASPGWNPEVAKALLEPTQPLQAAAGGRAKQTDAGTADVNRPPVVTEATSPVPASAATAPAETLAPDQQEEARWQALLAAPFFPERAEDYPFGVCFKEAAAENRLPLPVVLGLAAYQSNFDPEVVSDNGFGILNVGWPRPGKALGIASRETLIEDPCANISAGSAYLASLFSASQGRWVPALAAYRRHVDPAYLGRTRDEDLNFSRDLRRHVEEVIRQPYQPKTMYPFWEFDEGITARRFMKMVQEQSGVHLWMRQQGFSYVIFIPAAGPKEKERKLQLIEQETGLQAVLTPSQDAPS